MQPKYKKAFIAALALGIISSIHTRPRYPVFPLSILPTVLDVIRYFLMISIQIYVLEKVRNSKHSTFRLYYKCPYRGISDCRQSPGKSRAFLHL